VERDLDEVIEAALAERLERLGAAAPEASTLAGTVARIRRRHRRRAAGEVLGGVGIAAALVVALTLGGGRDGQTPVETPTATPRPTTTPTFEPTPTPTPTPDPSPTFEPLPTKAQLDAGLGLPATSELPKGVWDQVGEGWALGIYQPRWTLDDQGNDALLRQTVVLASPGGDAYRVLELPKSQSVELVRWEPGATKALVTIAPIRDGFTQQGVRGWLDLRSGELTKDPGAVGQKDSDGLLPDLSFEGLDHRGNEVWFATYGLTGGGGPATLVVQKPDGTLVHRVDLVGDVTFWGRSLMDPSGRYLAAAGHDQKEATYDVVDLDTGKQAAHAYGVAGKFCAGVGWQSANDLLTRCRNDSWWAAGQDWHIQHSPDPLYVVHLDGTKPRKVGTLADGDAALPLWSGRTLEDGRVVVGARPLGTDDDGSCTAGLYALDDDAAAPLGIDGVVRVTPVGSQGSRVYAVTDAACTNVDADGDPGGQSAIQLEATDGGERTALLRAPATGGAQLGGGLATWVVAGGPSGHYWG